MLRVKLSGNMNQDIGCKWKVQKNPLSLLEERECLTYLLGQHKSIHGDKKHEYLGMNYLNKAIQQDLLSEFILVEIWLRKYPKIAYSQSREVIESLAKYVTVMRGEKL